MPMPEPAENTLLVAELDQNQPTSFLVIPTADALAALAQSLDLLGLRKVRLEGQVAPQGRKDWVLTAALGATVVQPCVATLAPVTTRIDTQVRRSYLAEFQDPEDPETEMPDDDEAEALGPRIPLDDVLREALSLALPQYPRATDAEPVELRVTEPGKTAMTDEDARPFAGLAALRDTLSDDPDD